jgi:hypothetical protein
MNGEFTLKNNNMPIGKHMFHGLLIVYVEAAGSHGRIPM